jgi:hypothetical protein
VFAGEHQPTGLANQTPPVLATFFLATVFLYYRRINSLDKLSKRLAVPNQKAINHICIAA